MADKYVYDHVTKEVSTADKSFPITPGGIGKALFDKLKLHAEKGLIAQIQAETGIEDSYADFLNRSIKVALYLKEQGIKPGDIISMCSYNNMNNTVVFVASQFVGAILASTDPSLSLEETQYLLKLVEPKMVFVSDGSEDLIQNAIAANDLPSKLITLHEHASYENLPVLLGKYVEDEVQAFEPFYVEDLTTTSCIFFTSGTTGLSKGACVSHIFQEAHIVKHFDMPGKVIMGNPTLYWGTAIFFTVMQLHFGLTKVNRKQFIAANVWDVIEKYKVHICCLSYYQCMEALKTLNGPQESLGMLCIAGGQLADKYYKEYDAKLANTYMGVAYGMSECNGVTGRYPDYKMGSAGRPLDLGQTIKIVDTETEQALNLNEVGEIRVKSKYQMTGYYKMDSSDAWDADGFLKTGDLGYMDDEFNLFVVDRIKEMFKYRGFHVLPAKMETVLRGHPEVLHAVVVGVPAADYEHLAMGVVVLKDNGTVTSEALVEYVNSKTDTTHQIRAGIEIIKCEDMPYTVTGKISRQKVRERFAKTTL